MLCIRCGHKIPKEEIHRTNVADFHISCYRKFFLRVEAVMARRREEFHGKSYVTRTFRRGPRK